MERATDETAQPSRRGVVFGAISRRRGKPFGQAGRAQCLRGTPDGRRYRRHGQGLRDARGSLVLVALCLVTVLAIAVTGFFAVCLRTMELSNRSYCYTSSVQLAETGMEEALWSLDQALNTSGYTWSGWTLTTVGGVPTATRQITGLAVNRGLSGTVNIEVQYYNTTQPFTRPPIITSDGITPLQDGSRIDKQLKAIVKPAALFRNALASTAAPTDAAPNYYPFYGGFVAFYNDSTINVDSYDSTAGPYTPFPSTTNRSDQAVISGTYLNLANANILGYATTSNPTATAPTFNDGTLKGFGTVSSTDVDESRISNNGTQPTFDTIVPTQVTLLPSNQSIGPGAYYYTSTYYYVGPGSSLKITGPATIYLPYGLYVDVGGKIEIESNSTGPVQFYVGNWIYSYGDNSGDGIVNLTKDPSKLAIFGPSVTFCDLWQSTDFYGVVYLPAADIYLYGYPNKTQDIYGSVVGKRVISYYTNTVNVHYDLNLRKTTFSLINTPYEITEWIKD